MNYRVVNNVVPLTAASKNKAVDQNSSNKKLSGGLLSRACEKYYKYALEIWVDGEEENYCNFLKGIDDLILVQSLIMRHSPNEFTKEEHWRMMYLISISEVYLEKPLVIDIRKEYLMERMMESEKKPIEFLVDGRVVSFPYSIYAALGAYYMTSGDKVEGQLWLSYGEDRIKSFISDRPERVQNRIRIMFDAASMCFESEEGGGHYLPFIVEEREGIFNIFNR